MNARNAVTAVLLASTLWAQMPHAGATEIISAPAPPAQDCQEDDPCWDCETMGNGQCGPPPGYCAESEVRSILYPSGQGCAKRVHRNGLRPMFCIARTNCERVPEHQMPPLWALRTYYDFNMDFPGQTMTRVEYVRWARAAYNAGQ